MYAFHTHEYVVRIIIFSQYVIIWIKSIGEWMTCCHTSLRRKKKESRKGGKKGRRKTNDCEQHTDVCKLGANCDGQDFKNHKSWS